MNQLNLPKLDWKVISPEQAEKYLAKMPAQRRLKEPKVAELAAHMKAGTYRGENAQPIQFDQHGCAMNGQHRLTACVRSGVPFLTAVAVGVPRDAMSTIDIGSARSLADMQATCPLTGGPPRPHRNVAAVNGALRCAAGHFGGRGWTLNDYEASVTEPMFNLADELVSLFAGRVYPNLRMKAGAGIVGALTSFARDARRVAWIRAVAACLKHGPELHGSPDGRAKKAAEALRNYIGSMQERAEKEQAAYEVTSAVLETAFASRRLPRFGAITPAKALEWARK